MTAEEAQMSEPRHPISELYQGEVLGEALFDRMLADLDDAAQVHVVSCMMQLESETKARLRPAVVARGLPVAEEADARAEGIGIGASLASMTWRQKMTRLVAGVGDRYLPRYEALAEASGPGDAVVTESMVEHEKALLAALRHAANDRFDDAVAALEPHLIFPMPAPPDASVEPFTAG